MKKNLYVMIKESSQTEYVNIDRMFHENDLEKEYQGLLDFKKLIGSNRVETLEGYKLTYVLIKVDYDGRKGSISEYDILKSMQNQGLLYEAFEGGIFGGYYKMTDDLLKMMHSQFLKRKDLNAVVA